jgi:tRNA threonylcarbamoyl adenosine modification protein YjeE
MISKSIEETSAFARELAAKASSSASEASVIGLSGDLGSGKTTFTKAFAEAFDIPSEEITSPTFVIMKSYDVDRNGFKKLIHIDAYRLERAEEIERLGWKELISDPGNLILIEWPENIGEAMPASAKSLQFRFVDATVREISVK